MSNALKNSSKLRAWVDLAGFGADPTGVGYSDTALSQAIATGKPIRPGPGTFRFASAINRALAIGQDFVIEGDGEEVTNFVFEAIVTGGISVTYSTNGTGQAQGDKSAVRINGISLETKKAGGGVAVAITNTPPAGQVNETQVAVTLSNLRINGNSDAAYWDTHIELTNVTFPTIINVTSQDSADRGVGISINTTGDYAGVEYTITNYRANEIATALKVRGRTEGVYMHGAAIVGGVTGVDWLATVVAGGKKPLLDMTGSHINVSGTAVKAVDVSQIIAGDCLIYVTNSTTAENLAFDFQATGALSNENHQIKGVTIIGLGSRVSSLAKAIKLGANVAGCSIDALIDNFNVAVANAGVNNFISPGSRFNNCNTRTTGFTSLGAYGEVGTTASVDGSLQVEVVSGTAYTLDQARKQERWETFTHTCASGTETFTRTLDRPFRTDTLCVIACFGEPPSGGAAVGIATAGSTATEVSFSITGASPGDIVRINYCAIGY